MIGSLPPVCFWDPLEFAKNGSKDNVLRSCAAKIKHGRFSLQACIGYFVREYSKLGGYLSPSMGIKLSGRPSGSVALSQVPLACWLLVVAFCSLSEYTGFTFTQRRSIGRMTAKLNASLASGRLAIMATVWIFFQDGFTSSAAESA